MKTKPSSLVVLCAVALASCAGTGGEVRRFDVVNRFEVSVPEGTEELRGWFALPDDGEELQDVSGLDVRVDASGGEVATREVRDPAGNRFLYLEAVEAGGASIVLETSFELERREASASIDPADTRPPSAGELEAMKPFLGEGEHVRITPEIRLAASSAVGSETNPTRQARLLYDWVLDHVQYWVKDPDRLKSSGVGSSTYCFERCTGNCTDFHSLYAAAARSVGLPTRMVYGSFFKGPLDGEERDQSYHCWIEYWAPEVGWIPLDVAVADIFVDDFQVTAESEAGVSLTVADGYHGPDPRLVDYYFGNLDARRVTWNRGRDLLLDPPPAAGAINALPKAHVEADGVPLAEKSGWTRMLTFRELP